MINLIISIFCLSITVSAFSYEIPYSVNFEKLKVGNDVWPLLSTGDKGIPWKVEILNGNKVVNIIPNGNPSLKRHKYYDEYILGPFKLRNIKKFNLAFKMYSTSNPQIKKVHNCDSSMNLYVKYDDTKWSHVISYCGQHMSETTKWQSVLKSFISDGSKNVSFKFRYYLQNSNVGNSEVFYLIDDISVNEQN